jgi:hypothetical protein
MPAKKASPAKKLSGKSPNKSSNSAADRKAETEAEEEGRLQLAKIQWVKDAQACQIMPDFPVDVDNLKPSVDTVKLCT